MNKLMLFVIFLTCFTVTSKAVENSLELTSSSASGNQVDGLENVGAIGLFCKHHVQMGQQKKERVWYKDGLELNKSTFDVSAMQLVGAERWKLYLHNLRTSLSGCYKCCVFVMKRQICSNIMKVIIHKLPSFILFKNIIVGKQGSNVTISMEVNGSSLSFWHSFWAKNSTPLFSTVRDLNFTKQSTYMLTLTLTNVNSCDAGQYHVELSNNHWKQKSPTIAVFVEVFPAAPLRPDVHSMDTSLATGPQLRVQWQMPHVWNNNDSEMNLQADHFVVYYQMKEDDYLRLQRWHEVVVFGEHDTVITGLSPCTVYEVKVAGCNSIGCGDLSASAVGKTHSDPNREQLHNKLYMGQRSGMLLFKDGDDVAPLCVSSSHELDASFALCNILLYLDDTNDTAAYDYVFIVYPRCALNHATLSNCNYSCPAKAATCTSSQQLVDLRTLCGLHPTVDTNVGSSSWDIIGGSIGCVFFVILVGVVFAVCIVKRKSI